MQIIKRHYFLLILLLVLLLVSSCRTVEFKIATNYNKKDAANQMHGVWLSFYENGKLSSVKTYKHGIKHGLFKEYFDSGELKSIGKYKKDKPIGNHILYSKSGPLSIMKYRRRGEVKVKSYNYDL